MSTSVVLRMSCQSYTSIHSCSNPSGVFGLRLSFLIWVISGVKPAPKKVQSVVDWPTPAYLHEALQIYGLINIFTEFIQGYANLTITLTDLSKHVVVDCNSSCNFTLQALKHAVTPAPVLAFPDPDKSLSS